MSVYALAKMLYGGGNAYATRIKLLLDDNYDHLKMQAKALLIKNDTWAYVSG